MLARIDWRAGSKARLIFNRDGIQEVLHLPEVVHESVGLSRHEACVDVLHSGDQIVQVLGGDVVRVFLDRPEILAPSGAVVNVMENRRLRETSAISNQPDRYRSIAKKRRLSVMRHVEVRVNLPA